jgi:hypothetical protein
MMYSIGRGLGRLFRAEPFLSTVAVAGLVVVVLVQCTDLGAMRVPTSGDGGAAPPKLAAAGLAAERATLEVVKTPEQRASELAAKAAEEKVVAERKAKEEAKRKAWEASVEKASLGVVDLPWWKQCAGWGRELRRHRNSAATEAYYRAVKSQGLINDQDEMAVVMKQRLPDVGMTRCGALAILGPGDAANVTTNAYATNVQTVYRDRQIYIYTTGRPGDHNGLVRTVQY